METSIGRILFNNVLPESHPFINKEITKSILNSIIDDIITEEGIDKVAPFIDALKDFGFKYLTKSGVTWSMDDVKIPEGKAELVKIAEEKSLEVLEQFNEGLLSQEEKHRKNVSIWQDTKSQIEKLVGDGLDKNSPVYDMVISGARGSVGNLTQMVGMKGLITNSQGETLELPIVSSFKEGFTPIEYFISSHGTRKGMTDIALNTAKSGYLTRKLFVAAQSVMITEEDCGTKEGVIVKRVGASGIEQSMLKIVAGRVLSKDILNGAGEVIFKRNHLVSKEDAKVLDKQGINEAFIRSPLVCKTPAGICRMCYGSDLGRNKLVETGEAVGTIAAQAIGEPGTQLTMRTFHSGGVAVVGGDITAGLPRVEEVFEKRNPKNAAVVVSHDGMITDIKEVGKEKIIKMLPDVPTKSKKGSEIEYSCHYARVPLVKVGQHVSKGDIITDGHASIEDLFTYSGKAHAQEYIISEIKKIYELQGENVSRKHIEIIVRQMFSRVKVKIAGDTQFAIGDIVEQFELDQENARVKDLAGGAEIIEAKGEPIVLGITEASLTRRSFLSAASFQHTNRMLINASLKAQKDPLYGIMENVIIGRLIPAGTGFKDSEKYKMIEKLRQEVIEEEDISENI